MSPLVTNNLEIDQRAVHLQALRDARADLNWYAANRPDAAPSYLEALAARLRRVKQWAQRDLDLETERARLRAMSEADRRAEYLQGEIDRCENPSTCPGWLFEPLGTRAAAHVAGLRGELAALTSSHQRAA